MSESTNTAAVAAAVVVPEAELAELAIGDSATNGKPATNGGTTNGTSAAATAPASPAAAAAPAGDFKESFKAFSKFGDSKSDGKHITLSQSDKWMKQAKVIDKKITTTDTAIHFKKLKSMKLAVADYSKFLEDLAAAKKMDVADIKAKLSSCGAPGVAQSSVCVTINEDLNMQICNLSSHSTFRLAKRRPPSTD